MFKVDISQSFYNMAKIKYSAVIECSYLEGIESKQIRELLNMYKGCCIMIHVKDVQKMHQYKNS